MRRKAINILTSRIEKRYCKVRKAQKIFGRLLRPYKKFTEISLDQVRLHKSYLIVEYDTEAYDPYMNKPLAVVCVDFREEPYTSVEHYTKEVDLNYLYFKVFKDSSGSIFEYPEGSEVAVFELE